MAKNGYTIKTTSGRVRSGPYHGADVGKSQRAWNALQRIYNLNQGAYHKKGKHAGKRLYGRPTS